MQNKQLKAWGLPTNLADQTYPRGLIMGRVVGQNHTMYKVKTAADERQAAVSGRLANLAIEAQDYPAVGDWVLLRENTASADMAIIERLLPRHSLFLRKTAGRKSTAQIVATNVDTVFICMALDENYNLNRLARYLVVAWDSGATPVVVLTKADLTNQLTQRVTQVTQMAAGAQVVTCSVTNDTWHSIVPYVRPSETVAFIGSSGVGKTTLINQLMGEQVGQTQAVRESDAHGRHTTTSRDLLQLPNGGLVIDTPGMRELSVLNGGFKTTFADIEDFARMCKFNDCTHTSEPGCAVQAAIQAGHLSQERLDSYRQLSEEATTNQALHGKAREDAKLARMFGSKKTNESSDQGTA